MNLSELALSSPWRTSVVFIDTEFQLHFEFNFSQFRILTIVEGNLAAEAETWGFV